MNLYNPVKVWRPQAGNQQPGSQALKLLEWHLPEVTSVG